MLVIFFTGLFLTLSLSIGMAQPLGGENTELPLRVKAILASREIRTLHLMWHFARGDGGKPNPIQKSVRKWFGNSLKPRGSRGSGEQFLRMHRHFMQLVNSEIKAIGGPAAHEVRGWRKVPIAPGDPIPPTFSIEGGGLFFFDAKSRDPARYARRANTIEQISTDAWIRSKSISDDSLGRRIERELHEWMHNRWAEEKGYRADTNGNLSPTNDNLLNPFSSHVNLVFWKIHGWIDDRFSAWIRFHPVEAEAMLQRDKDVICGVKMANVQKMRQIKKLSDLQKYLASESSEDHIVFGRDTNVDKNFRTWFARIGK
jgi:hypothetical protein